MEAMNSINFKREITASMDEAVARVSAALAEQGFGILTRIDLHSKIREKIGKNIIPTVILGACNPTLAYEAYNANSGVAGLLPCNAVLRELESGKISVELTAPTAMMRVLGDDKLVQLAAGADKQIELALARV
jgi:uncharacterized protein (DUF302 family)